MKIAIIHDWLVVNAGAEKVLREINILYPDADIYSLVDFLNEKDKKEILDKKEIKTSFIQKLPYSKKYFRNYLFLFPWAIESFDLKSYDLIISSSWAVSKGIKKSKNQIHISYCHTPIRYAWDLYDEYILSVVGIKKIIVNLTLSYLRSWDIKSLNRVDFFISNSKFVQKRIEQTYKRDALVIYPPVNMEAFSLEENKEDFYLTACRLVPYKKTKLIVEAFNCMPDKKLIVIGFGDEYKEIKKIKKDNIILLGYQEFDSMVLYMKKAKAFVYAAIEDFGIVPIEAMSCGTPVIALNDGGTAETILDKITGIHFEEQNIESIIAAIEVFEETSFDYKKIREHAKKYNKFSKEFSSFVDEKIKGFI